MRHCSRLEAFPMDESTLTRRGSLLRLGGNVVHTGQLYFPETLTDAVYRKAPYSSRPSRETRNANDSVYRNGGSKSLMRIRKNSAGVYVATITMGVHRS